MVSVKRNLMQNIRLPGAFLLVITFKINLLKTIRHLILCMLLACAFSSPCQTITGAWKGKIGAARAELKLIKKGDSLLGTSYYYTSASHYRRYAVKGYFDSETNSVVWWDDKLLEDKAPGGLFGTSKEALLNVADFNCPGEEKMTLEGNSTDRDNKDRTRGPVQLEKETKPGFRDEWDFVIENYTVGANDPDIIDSVALVSNPEPAPIKGYETALSATKIISAQPEEPKPIIIAAPVLKEEKKAVAQNVNEQKFKTREKKLATVIPITGDSIELRFYDNAIIDGDSISVFLNGHMLFEHVRLEYKPYTVKLAVSDLQDDNELVMVAENLGTIPPNTSLMVVIVGDNRYEARLESSEQTSALIRFIKQKKVSGK